MTIVTHANHPLNTIPFDSELTPGARNAVQVCLRVQPSEKVTVITDDACREIAAAIVHELEKLGCPYRAFVLEELAPRPLVKLPQVILADLETSQVSIFAVQVQRNELQSRMQMTEIVNRKKIRHAHMVNINRQIMLEGMRAPSYKWLKTSGIISPDKWGNLPGGEVFTTPGEVNGIFVIDGVVGDYLCAKFGDLQENPLTIQIEENRLSGAECQNKVLRDDFWAYTHSDENSNRVGEFAIGTNIELKDVIGEILQDEKYPGVHIAFGNPYGAHTGAEWYSSTHIDVVGRNFDIWVDREQIMRGGQFLIEA